MQVLYCGVGWMSRGKPDCFSFKLSPKYLRHQLIFINLFLYRLVIFFQIFFNSSSGIFLFDQSWFVFGNLCSYARQYVCKTILYHYCLVCKTIMYFIWSIYVICMERNITFNNSKRGRASSRYFKIYHLQFLISLNVI